MGRESPRCVGAASGREHGGGGFIRGLEAPPTGGYFHPRVRACPFGAGGPSYRWYRHPVGAVSRPRTKAVGAASTPRIKAVGAVSRPRTWAVNPRDVGAASTPRIKAVGAASTPRIKAVGAASTPRPPEESPRCRSGLQTANMGRRIHSGPGGPSYRWYRHPVGAVSRPRIKAVGAASRPQTWRRNPRHTDSGPEAPPTGGIAQRRSGVHAANMGRLDSFGAWRPLLPADISIHGFGPCSFGAGGPSYRRHRHPVGAASRPRTWGRPPGREWIRFDGFGPCSFGAGGPSYPSRTGSSTLPPWRINTVSGVAASPRPTASMPSPNARRTGNPCCAHRAPRLPNRRTSFSMRCVLPVPADGWPWPRAW